MGHFLFVTLKIRDFSPEALFFPHLVLLQARPTSKSLNKQKSEDKTMGKLVTFKDNGMEEVARRAVGGSRLRLQEELNRIVGLNIDCGDGNYVETTTEQKGGFVSHERGGAISNTKGLMDIELFKGVRYLRISGSNAEKRQIYAHRWSDSIENLIIESPEVLAAAAPYLGRLVNLKGLSVVLGDNDELTLPKETKARLTYFSGKGGTDYSCLEGCDKLEELVIKSCGAKTFDTLPKLPKVKRLDVTGLNRSHLAGIERLPSLEYLNLSNSAVTDLSALSALKAINTLGLVNNKLSDITPLAGLSVETLGISSNMVEDISPLAGKESLVYLDLASNPIEDITPLTGCVNLELLHLRDTWVNDLSPLFGMKNLQELTVDLRFIRDKKQFQQLSHVATINGRYFADFMEHNALDM